jgi:hypothetical protein
MDEPRSRDRGLRSRATRPSSTRTTGLAGLIACDAFRMAGWSLAVISPPHWSRDGGLFRDRRGAASLSWWERSPSMEPCRRWAPRARGSEQLAVALSHAQAADRNRRGRNSSCGPHAGGLSRGSHLRKLRLDDRRCQSRIQAQCPQEARRWPATAISRPGACVVVSAVRPRSPRGPLAGPSSGTPSGPCAGIRLERLWSGRSREDPPWAQRRGGRQLYPEALSGSILTQP